MNILDSAWLLKMLKKSGTTPQMRLLSLFDILADWADAPQIRESLLVEKDTTTPHHLLDYLTEEAQACGAQLPEALAQQLYFVALGALQESLRSTDDSNFSHAKLAAKALIIAQTEKESLKNKPWLYNVAASVFAIVFVGGFLLYNPTHRPITTSDSMISTTSLQAAPTTQDGIASPQNTAEMYASFEQMRQGNCQYPQVLTIPDAHKKIYLENVVAGQVPENAQDQAVALSYIKKIQCNYTPMLMKNSVN